MIRRMTRYRETMASLQDAADTFQTTAPSVLQAMEDEGQRVGKAADAVFACVNQVAGAVTVALADVRRAANAVEMAAQSNRQITDFVYAALIAIGVGLAAGYLITGAKDAIGTMRRYFG